MLRLKNRNMAPPAGFIVDVPETGYHHVFWGFDEAVTNLTSHLAANPGIFIRFPTLPRTKQACEDYVDTRNAMRCMSIKHGENYVLKGGPITPAPFQLPEPPPPPHPPFPGAAGAGVASKAQSWFRTLGKMGIGAKTLGDWLPDAKSVSPELAEQRATICAACPKNSENVPKHKGNWLNLFNQYASNLIRRQLEERKNLKLSTTKDDKLGMCLVCECPLKLALHVPLEDKIKRMPAKDKENLDLSCWILSEERRLTTKAA